MAEANPVELLVRKAQGGDRLAFEELIETHRDRLLSRVRRGMSTQLQRRIDPEDVVQDALCTAFETIGKFRWQGEGSFYAWIAAIAEHLILNATKQRRVLQLDTDLATSGATPGKLLGREERYRRLKSSLRALTPDQQEAVMLARIDGLPMQEIANRMNRSEAAVRQLLTRAVRELRTSFGDTESLHLPERSLREEGIDSD